MKTITGKCKECSKRTQGKKDNGFMCRKCSQKKDYEAITAKLHDMNDFDFGWLVGLVEGEGCFYCKESNCKISSGQYCYPLAGFTVMSTDYDVMDNLGILLGIKPKGPYYKKSEKERKVVWSIQITGNKVMAIMCVLRQHLSERRQQQIDRAIDWQNKGRFEIMAANLA